MKCPNCDSSNVLIINSRSLNDETQRRRRYECSNCRKRFWTMEVYEDTWTLVKEAAMSRQTYCTTPCNNKKCKRHLQNFKPVEGQTHVSLADLGGTCRYYIARVIEEIEEDNNVQHQ